MPKKASTSKRPGEMRLLVGLVLAVAVLIFAALILLGAAAEQEKTTRWVAHSRDVLERIHRVVTFLSDAENGRRGYVLSGEDRYLAHYTNGLSGAETALNELRELSRDNPGQSAACDELEALIHLRRGIFTNSIRAQQERGLELPAQTAFMEQGQRAMDPVRQLAARMAEEETARLKEQQDLQDENVKGAQGFAVLVSLVGLGFFSLLLFFLARANRRKRQAEQVLQQTNQELEERVEQRTAELRAASDEVLRVNRELELRVRERTAQLETANKELEAFSYSVSHDLRAPLRHIQGYADMLMRAGDGQLSEKAQRYLKTIVSAGAEMGQLIDDLLEFSRLGRAELHERPVQLDGLVRDVLQGLEMAVKDRDIQWRIEPLPTVSGDPTALRQVLANLIGNAVKYTGRRETAEIQIGSKPGDDGMITVFVRDNGAGFDMAYAGKLFGVFQRLHRTDEFEGTGIGLASVRRMIARHGGRTWAEGAVDQGATFYFTLKPAPTGNA